MTKTRIILFLFATVLVVVIYSLPTVVVENEKENAIATDEPAAPVADAHPTNTGEIPDSLKTHINSLKDSFANSGNKEKRVIFADSLAKAFEKAFLLDSAAYYLAEAANELQTKAAYFKAGDAYYNAFNFAASKEKQTELGEKARYFYNKVLELDPDNNDAKANLALTYVTTASPMQGIAMLREILDEDPANERALYNLGLLSIMSGQVDKAVGRFRTLLKSHPDNYDAMLYLGYALLQEGKEDSAKIEFEKVIASDADPALKESANQYLETIKK